MEKHILLKSSMQDGLKNLTGKLEAFKEVLSFDWKKSCNQLDTDI